MHRWIAVFTAVATLGAPFAHANASGFSAGECVAIYEPQLLQLSEILDAAPNGAGFCESAEGQSFTPDSHIVTSAVSVPLFEGPRSFGEPSGERTTVVTSWLPVVIVDEGIAPSPIFVINRIEPYRKARQQHDAVVGFVRTNVSEPVGRTYARYSVIGPTWLKKWNAKSMTGLVDMAVEGIHGTAIMATTGGLGLAYLSGRNAEALWSSPLDTAEGGSELVDGVRTRDFDRALDGYTQACGGVVTALTIALPISKAVAPRARQTTRFVSGVSILDRRTGRVLQGTVDLDPTLQRIESGGAYPHARDGSVFENRTVKGRLVPELPEHPYGYYREYVHPTPGVQGPGPQRIVVGQRGELYYTSDHYRTFVPLN